MNQFPKTGNTSPSQNHKIERCKTLHFVLFSNLKHSISYFISTLILCHFVSFEHKLFYVKIRNKNRLKLYNAFCLVQRKDLRGQFCRNGPGFCSSYRGRSVGKTSQPGQAGDLSVRPDFDWVVNQVAAVSGVGAGAGVQKVLNEWGDIIGSQ